MAMSVREHNKMISLRIPERAIEVADALEKIIDSLLSEEISDSPIEIVLLERHIKEAKLTDAIEVGGGEKSAAKKAIQLLAFSDLEQRYEKPEIGWRVSIDQAVNFPKNRMVRITFTKP